MLKKYLKSNPSFVEIYDNALTKKECEILTSQFEKSLDATIVGSATTQFNWKENSNFLLVNKGTLYIKSSDLEIREVKRSCDLTTHLHLQTNPFSNIIRPALMSCIAKYSKKYYSLEKYSPSWQPDTLFNIQKYESENDGYKIWHCEHGPGTSSNRFLVWTIYLNDAKSGTEFMHYSTVSSKIGRCIIFPAAFTHMHRSELNRGLKYIATGWISYMDSIKNNMIFCQESKNF